MKTRKRFIGLLLCFLVLWVPLLVYAEKLQDPYEAFGLDQNDSDLAYRMAIRPPEVVVIRAAYLEYGGLYAAISSGDIRLELGGASHTMNFSDKFSDPNDGAAYSTVSTNLTIRYYANEKGEFEMPVQQNTHYGDNVYVEGRGEYVLMEGTETADTNAFIDSFNLIGDDKQYYRINLSKERDAYRSMIEAAVYFEIVGIIREGAELTETVVTSAADEGTGETGIGVSSDIVIQKPKSSMDEPIDGKDVAVGVGVAAVAAAAGVAGAGASAAGGVASGSGPTGGSGNADPAKKRKEDDEEDSDSTYQMRIHKDFGNKIKYDGKPVFVYARIVEITKSGIEKERLDLTSRIEIFSAAGVVKVDHTMLSGSYMGATIRVEPIGSERPTEGVISFRFNGDGGFLQNNVIFQLVGDPLLKLYGLHEDAVFMQAGGQKSVQLPFEAKDFVAKPQYSIGTVTEDAPCSVEIMYDKAGKPFLQVENASEKKETLTEFYETYQVELIAENENEFARAWARIIVCNEGLLAQFHGGKPEIKGYFDHDAARMAESVVDFKLGVWNEQLEDLDFTVPEELAFTYSDESRVCEIIGLKAEVDLDNANKEVIRYRLSAEKPFPNDEPIEGDFNAVCKQNDAFYEFNASVSLIPDIQVYNKAVQVEQEYQNCLKIISTYIDDKAVAEKLINELENNKELYQYGAEDYRIYRKYVWDRAQYYLMKEKTDYMRYAAMMNDFMIICDYAQWIGDIALEIVLIPVGGPLASFVIKNAKNVLVVVIGQFLKKGSLDMNDLKDIVSAIIGDVEDITSTTPGPTQYKKLMLWLVGFFAYRVVYHRCFGKDINDVPVGSWAEAMKKALVDLGVKTILTAFVTRNMPSHEKIGLSEAMEKKIIKTKTIDQELMKPLTGKGDAVVDYVDNKTASWIDALCRFLDGIVDGKSQFPTI